MMEAPAFSVAADVAIVKGETPAGDRAWLTCPDGTARRVVVHVVHDLPHLVVESVFGLDDGLWGTLARGRLTHVTRAHGRRGGRVWLVTGDCLDSLGEPDRPGRVLAKAAVNAVLNRWGGGQDAPDGVRDRMRAHSPRAADLADRLDDETFRIAAGGVKRLYRDWSMLAAGGMLRLSWPLHDSWLRAR